MNSKEYREMLELEVEYLTKDYNDQKILIEQLYNELEVKTNE